MAGYLDGFPRNVPQAEFLEQLLDEINQPFDFVIQLGCAGRGYHRSSIEAGT